MSSQSKCAGVILLVDDDDIFREVLASALEDKDYRVYQAANGSQALKVIHEKKDVAVVLSDIRMPEMDGVELLRQIRLTGNLPVILATGFSEVTETQTAHALGASGFLAKPFEMEELLALVGSQISGKDDKAKTSDEDFARILIDDFVSGKTLKHGIFIRLSKDKFVKIAHEGLDLDISRVRDYKARGVKYLYLAKKDFRDYLSTSLSLAKKVSASTIDRDRKTRFLRHTGNLIVEKVLVEELDSFAVEAARDFFVNSLEVITEDEALFRSLEILNEHSDHVYAHSLSVSIYSIMLARAMGWKSAPTTFRVGLAGLFHDIGLKEIDRKILDTARPSLSRGDRALYETHTNRSGEILNAAGSIPEEVIQAVVQHHEDPNGFGYPRGLKGQEICPLARVIAVVDAFCEYAIRNPDSPKGMAAGEAIEKMEQFRSAGLDPVYFKALKDLVRKGGVKAA
jgi:putative nucleotidyltransferase with HDIG domain